MSFAQIIFLFGAAAVIGPILAHLLARPRYRKVLFTMLHFLQTGQREVQARTRLRNLLLLLLRCAIIVLIAMLFAGPRVVRAPEAPKVRHVYYLGVDNSVSMAYTDGGSSLWDAAVARARDLVKSAPDDTVFNINALAGGQWGRSLSKGAADSWLSTMETVSLEARAQPFIAEIRNVDLHKSPDTKVSAAIVSDFTPAFLEDLAATDEPVRVDEVKIAPVTPGGPVKNAGIVRAGVAGGSRGVLELGVSARNYGGEAVTRTLLAKVHDAVVASAGVEIPAFSERAVTLAVPATAMPAGETCVPVELSLSGGDGLAADDHFYVAIWQAERKEKAVCIAGSAPRETFLLKTAIDALSSASWFETVRATEVLYRDLTLETLKGVSVAFFAGAPDALGDKAPLVASFVKEGGKAVFFLSSEPSAAAVGKLWREELLAARPRQFKAGEARIEAVSFAAATAQGAGVDEGTVMALQNYGMDGILLTGYHECEAAPDGAILWRLKNGAGFLYAKHLGNGVTFLVNTSADDMLGDLTKSPAAPAFCRLFLGRPAAPESRSFTCGQRVTVPAVADEIEAARAGRTVWALDPAGKSIEAPPADALLSLSGMNRTGWVRTMAKPVRCAGVNLPEGEADVTKPTEQEVVAAGAKVLRAAPQETRVVAGAPGGKEYHPVWKFFAWLVAALILLEAFVANRTQR